jgi:carbon-monoxide dehydrogenase medium subunit
VRHADFHHPVGDGALGATLATVARHIAHYPIRLRHTYCGSPEHADPAETCSVDRHYDTC